jgi:hypothetical protein
MNAFDRFNQAPPETEETWLRREEEAERFEMRRHLALQQAWSMAEEETHVRGAADFDPDNALLAESGCTPEEAAAFVALVAPRPPRIARLQMSLFEEVA